MEQPRVITQTEFDQKMNQSVLYTDLLGEQHCIRLGLSQSQLMARYAVQLELWGEYGN